jgi:hypothetical protein
VGLSDGNLVFMPVNVLVRHLYLPAERSHG